VGYVVGALGAWAGFYGYRAASGDVWCPSSMGGSHVNQPHSLIHRIDCFCRVGGRRPTACTNAYRELEASRLFAVDDCWDDMAREFWERIFVPYQHCCQRDGHFRNLLASVAFVDAPATTDGNADNRP
jgi:hypothetical protein